MLANGLEPGLMPALELQHFAAVMGALGKGLALVHDKRAAPVFGAIAEDQVPLDFTDGAGDHGQSSIYAGRILQVFPRISGAIS